MSIVLWTAVVLIGGAGSVLRFLVDGAVGGAAGRDFPLGTMAVNLSGAVVLGLLAVYVATVMVRRVRVRR